MTEIRIDKFLADRTNYSRNAVRLLLKQGAVCADGVRMTDAKQKINPDTQEITLHGKKIHSGSQLYIIINKPKDYLCATEDKYHKTVLELLPDDLRHKDLFPAGRLDLDSTGLVLLTTDGQLAHQMLSPKHHVPKYYLVTLARNFEDSYPEQLAAGMTLSDGTECLPAQVQKISEKICLVCLHEGKYHQVKRMFAAVGNHVEHLHRTAVGGMILPPDLPLGGHLEIFHKDILKLLKPESFQAVYEQIMSDFSSYSINDGQ